MEGPQAVREAVSADAVVELFATAEAAARHPDVFSACDRASIVTSTALKSLAETVQPQGLVAVCGYVDGPVVPGRLVVVLDGIADPGNAGTVLRTADAAGADCVVFPDGSVDPYNGKCVRSAAGSLFHLPVVRGGDVSDHIITLRRSGMSVVAADAHGDRDLVEAVADGVLDGPTAWVFGSEAHGLSSRAADGVDTRIKVPVYGQAESLNLSIAAAVCLYASAGQHRKGASP